MFEFACSFDSQMGKTNADLEINHVRLCKEMVDLLDPNVVVNNLSTRFVKQQKLRHHTFGHPSRARQVRPGNI